MAWGMPADLAMAHGASPPGTHTAETVEMQLQMLRCVLGLLLLAASASATDYPSWSFATLAPKATSALTEPADGRRRLQSGQGALDLDICASGSAPITRSVGTVHDDDISNAVDCSLGSCSCGAGNDQSANCRIGCRSSAASLAAPDMRRG